MGNYQRKHPPSFLIDRILPVGEVNLITGPSGAGKTTLWAQLASQWQEGEPIWGYSSHPQPWVYIALDRSLSETEDRLLAAGLDLSELDFYSLDDRETLNIQRDLEPLVKPQHKLVMIEASQRLLGEKGEGNDYASVAKLMARLKRWIRPRGLTVLLSAHDAKTKKDAGYENARERIAGSVAWAGTSSTVFQLSITGADTRTLSVQSRWTAPFERQYLVGDEGRLQDLEEMGLSTSASDTLLAIIMQLPPGSEVTYEHLEQIGHSLDISTRTIRNVISDAKAAGIIARTSNEGTEAIYERLEGVMTGQPS